MLTFLECIAGGSSSDSPVVEDVCASMGHNLPKCSEGRLHVCRILMCNVTLNMFTEKEAPLSSVELVLWYP